MTLAPLVVEALRGQGSDIPVVLGGIVPPQDLEELKLMGVAAVFGPGASGEEIVDTITSLVKNQT
jgi:methylmalonyl-CoA mutase C-terminal domain/subunit